MVVRRLVIGLGQRRPGLVLAQQFTQVVGGVDTCSQVWDLTLPSRFLRGEIVRIRFR
jgi:hypothetical protein